MDKKKQDKHSRVKTFIKTVNYNHLMPTRYTLDVDLKATVTPDALENATKTALRWCLHPYNRSPLLTEVRAVALLTLALADALL